MHEDYTMVSVKWPLLNAAIEAYGKRHNSFSVTKAQAVRAAIQVYLENDETEGYED